MNRVTTPLLTLAALSLLAGNLHAGEAERAAANKFLEGQTAVNESIVGAQTLKVRMLRQDVGSMTVNVEKGEYEGKACYVLTMKGSIDFGNKTEIDGKSYIAPDMSLLHGEETEKENGELSKHSLYEDKNGLLIATFKQPKEEDESKRDQSFEIKPEQGLLIGSAEILVTMLLPREKGQKLEFLRWNSTADKVYSLMVECAGDDDYNNKTVTKFVEHDKKFNEDELGNIDEVDAENSLWFDGHKLVRMDSADGFTLESNEAPKLTPITREMIDKQGDEVTVAAGFFLAANSKDEDLLKALLNEFKIVRGSLDTNPMTKDATDEQKDELAEMYADTVVQNIMNGDGEEKTEEDKKREAAVVKLLLHKENFVAEVKDDVHTVRMAKDAAKMFGKLQFTLEKTEEGKWEITGIGDVPEEEASETPPEKKKDDGEKKKEEEDGF